MEAWFEASFSVSMLTVEELVAPWQRESARTSPPLTYHDHFEPIQWLHPNIFNKECMTASDMLREHRNNDRKVSRINLPWQGRSKQFLKEFETFSVILMDEKLEKRAGYTLSGSDSWIQ